MVYAPSMTNSAGLTVLAVAGRTKAINDDSESIVQEIFSELNEAEAELLNRRLSTLPADMISKLETMREAV